MGIYRNDNSITEKVIHQDLPNEINTIPAKVVPVDTDLLLIEDSTDSFNKKKVVASDLKAYIGGGGSPLNLVELLPQVATDTPYLTRGSAFVGGANNAKWTLSYWMRPQNVSNTAFLFNLNNDFTIRMTGNGVQIDGIGSTGGSSVKMVSVLDVLKAHGLIHILASCDLSANPVEKHFYVNGVENNDAALFTSVQGEVVKFSGASTVYGNQLNLSTPFNAPVGGFWLNPGTFFDFSVQANREKFIGSDSLPVDLGTNGETPTGTSPLIFINNPAPSVQTNLGTGGDFTVGNGPFIPSITL